MINRDEIEAGDRIYTRDGGCLVAYDANGIWLGTSKLLDYWNEIGLSHLNNNLHIIRIEKAPKPVVKVNWLMWDDEFENVYLDTEDKLYAYKHAIKLTIINGKLEKSEQVK